MEWGLIADLDDLAVGDGEREAGALKEGAKLADVGEGGNARRGASGRLGLGDDESLSQLVEGGATKQGGEHQAVGLEGAAHLEQRPRKIVDELQRKARDDEIERRGSDWERLFVSDDARESCLGDEIGGDVGRDEGVCTDSGFMKLPAQGARAGAQIECHGEVAADQRQALDEVFGNASMKEVRCGDRTGESIAPRRQKDAIEDTTWALALAHKKLSPDLHKCGGEGWTTQAQSAYRFGSLLSLPL